MTCVLRSAALLALWVVVISATTARGDDPSAGEKRPAEKPATQPSAKARVLVTISKETTYITEPLRKDGYPDYVAVLNRRCSEGVTPENNSAVLFWKAMGPGSIDDQYREKYFRMLGIPPLPEKGDYFIPLDKYLKAAEAS